MNDAQRQALESRINRREGDIHVGYATLLACSRHGQDGWALPGEGFTASRLRAMDVAREMNRAMGGSA